MNDTTTADHLAARYVRADDMRRSIEEQIDQLRDQLSDVRSEQHRVLEQLGDAVESSSTPARIWVVGEHRALLVRQAVQKPGDGAQRPTVEVLPYRLAKPEPAGTPALPEAPASVMD